MDSIWFFISKRRCVRQITCFDIPSTSLQWYIHIALLLTLVNRITTFLLLHDLLFLDFEQYRYYIQGAFHKSIITWQFWYNWWYIVAFAQNLSKRAIPEGWYCNTIPNRINAYVNIHIGKSPAIPGHKIQQHQC